MNLKSEFKNGWRIQFKRPLAARAGVLLLCLAAAGSPAQTHTVTSCTEAALRSAMAGGGTVTFACSGTITLANTVVIGANTMLDGRGQEVTLSGGNAIQVFYINTNISLTLVDLTIAGGLSTTGYGGAIYNEGTFNATNCRLVANTVQGPPGVTYPDPGQDGCGGAVYNLGALNMVDCSFVSNSACGGQGSSSQNASGSVDGGSGGGGGDGGAVYNLGALNMVDCSFVSNSACGGTGSSWTGPGTGMDYMGGAGGAAWGGAICNLGGMAMERSLFASNTTVGGTGGSGQNGRGFYGPAEPPPWPAGSGGAGGDACGGALFVGGPSSLINCTLAGNQAGGGTGGAGGGGSIWLNMPQQPVFFPGGSGGSGGTACGAVYDVTGAIRLTNCTIAFNSSVGGPGGGGGAGNPSGSTGGSGVAAGAVQTANGVLVNCLLDGNSPTNSTGSITDAGHNLSSDASCTFTHVGSLNNTEPKLGPLANNGGPTLTMALLPGSPAIDAGDTSLAPATDQRGFPRPVGLAADIGAFEYGSGMLVFAVSRSGATGLNILGRGNAGQPCRLLWSSDLSSWVPMATNCLGSDGTILFHDNCAPGGACRFYLLVMP